MIIKKKLGFVVIITLIASMVLTACGSKDTTKTEEAGEVTIAVVAPYSGDYAQYGDAFKKATELKAKEINSAGGIAGKELKLIFMDDKNDAKEATIIAQRLVDDKKVAAVIGNFSSTAALASAPIYQSGGLVQFSPTSSHPDFTAQGTYMFRNINTQAIEGPIVADMVVNKMEKKRIAIIYQNNDWGITAKDNFTLKAIEFGAEIVAEETFIGGQTKDFTPTLTKISATNPDVLVLVAFYAEAGMIAQQMKQLDLSYSLAGLSSLYNQELIKLAGDSVNGLYLTTNFFPEDESDKVRKFVEDFKASYDSDPNQFAAVAYDTLGMLAYVIEKTGLNREAIRDELAKVTDYDGVTGKISFNEKRDVIKSMKVLQIQQGSFKQVK